MGVTCANCGEPMMGAVNRCWKCGQQVLSTPDATTAPPVRRSSPPAEASTADVDTEVVQATVAEETPSETPLASSRKEVSPPIYITNPAVMRPVEQVAPVRPAEYRKGGWANWLAIASLVLGLFATIFGAFAGWIILFAAAGLACGIVGLQSRRRTLAIAGLLLCLFGTTVSSVRLAYDTFTFIRGEPPVPMENLSEDELLLDPYAAEESMP